MIIVDLDPAVAVRIEAPERLAQLLNDDARPDEAVERNAWRGRVASAGLCGFRDCPARGQLLSVVVLVKQKGRRTIFLLHKVEQRRGEVVPELPERVAQFITVDRSRAVSVEVLEHVLPVFDILPQTRELHKWADRTSVRLTI